MHLLLIDEKGLPFSSGTHYMYNLEINIFGFCWNIQIYLKLKCKTILYIASICSL